MNQNFNHCAECRMLVTDGEYHPYAACVLYKQLGQADKVRSCLNSVIQYAQGKCVFEATGGETLPVGWQACKIDPENRRRVTLIFETPENAMAFYESVATGTDGEDERKSDPYAGINRCKDCGKLLAQYCEGCQLHPISAEAEEPQQQVRGMSDPEMDVINSTIRREWNTPEEDEAWKNL